MSITAEKLRVDVEADTSKAERSIGGFQKGLGAPVAGFNALRGAAIAFAGTAVAAFAGKTIMAASDLNEVVSKTGIVFGPASKRVIDAANAMADAFGIPKTEFLDAASGIGLVAKASGLGQKAAAGMSTDLAKLAADAASFYNVPLPEALDAMKSGLVGEAEPMRRFGVLLSENAVKAEAYRLGLAKTGSELTEGQKVQARSSLIMKGMSDASGDLARTQDSVANRLREIKGRALNAAAGLGTALLPAVSALLGGLITLGGKIADVVKWVKDWATNNATVQRALQVVGDAVARVQAFVVAMIPVVQAWLAEMGQRLLPVLQQVAQWIGANLVPIIMRLAQIISQNVIPMARELASWFMTKIVPAAMSVYQTVASNLMPIFNQLVATFRGSVLPVLQNLMAKFRENQPAIQGVIEKVQTFVGHLLKVASVILGTVLPPVIKFAGWLLEKLVPAIATVIIWTIKIIGKVFEVADAFLSAITAVGKFVAKIVSGIVDAVQAVMGLERKVVGALSGAATMLLSAGKDLVLGFINGIKAMAGQAADAAKDMAMAAVDKAKSFLKIGSPSKLLEQIGKWTGEGFVNGLSGSAEQVGAAMDGLMSKVHDAIGKGQGNIETKTAEIVNGVRGKLMALGNELTQTQGYFAQVAASVASTGGLSGLGGRTDENGAALGPTAQTMIEDLGQRVRDAAAFASNLQALKARGLNAQAIAELAQAGVQQAGAAAAAMVQGGTAIIAQANVLQTQLNAQANKAAAVGSAAMFTAGELVAKGLADGFRSQRQAILGEMDDMGQRMVKRLRKVLGIHSPSKEGHYVGRMLGKGVQGGAEGTLRDLQHTSEAMAGAVTPDAQGGFQASRWQPGVVPSGGWDTASNAAGPAIGEVHFHDASLSPAEQVRAMTWAYSTRGR